VSQLLKQEITHKCRAMGQLKRAADNADSQHRFFESVVTALQRQQDQQVECPICLCDVSPQYTGITPCGHCFHEDCLKTVLANQASCPQCRHPVTVGDILKGCQLLTLEKDSCAEDTRSQYGTKIACMVSRVRRLRAEDPTAKVIVFVQWEMLLAKVNKSLTEGGCACLQLRGAVYQRSQTLRLFEDSPAAEHAVLLLSLEKSPTGMNLTVANHVFLLHPMLADSEETAIGYERQAIGRVRRQGQAKTVHLWRFVTIGTVEETMTKQRQRSLRRAATVDG